MINIDADQRNADWIKTVSWEYPTDAQGFLQFLGGPEFLEHFFTLPVAEQMPDGLRAELAVKTGKRIPVKSFDPSLHPRNPDGTFRHTFGGSDLTEVRTPSPISTGDVVQTPDRGPGIVRYVSDDGRIGVQTQGQGPGAPLPYRIEDVTKLDISGGEGALTERSAVITPEGHLGFITRITQDLEGREHATVEYRSGDIHADLPYMVDELKPIDVSNGTPIYDEFGHEAAGRTLAGTFVVATEDNPYHKPGEVIGILGEVEARRIERRSAAYAPPFEKGERVVATSGEIGTLQRYDSMEGTSSVRLDDGRVLADVVRGLQHAGQWETPKGWEAAGFARGSGRAREVYTGRGTKDGSGRVYAVEYPAEWDTANLGPRERIAGLRSAVKFSVRRNHEVEKDSGLTNRWNGTIRYDTMDEGVTAYKDWGCPIGIGDTVLNDIPESAKYPLNPKDIEDGEAVLTHELAHGLSESVTPHDYKGNNIPLEEGVVEAYRQAFMAVRQRGPDALSPLDGGSDAFPPGYMSYNAYTSGVTQALLLRNSGVSNPPDVGRPETWKDRLDWARELLQIPLDERQDKIDKDTAASGQHVVFIGQGIGSHMGYRVESNEAKSRTPQTANDVRDVIFASLGSVEDATRALDVVRTWIANHPEDALGIGMDAECLHMFITAHGESIGAKEFNPFQPRDEHGRWTDAGMEITPNIGVGQGRGPFGVFEEFVPTSAERRGVIGADRHGQTLHIGDHVLVRNRIGQIRDVDPSGQFIWVGMTDTDELREVRTDSVERLERKDWDPALHPRDSEGRFAETAGVTGILEPPASRLEDFSDGQREMWESIMADYGVSIDAIAGKIDEWVDQDAIDHAEAWYPSASQLSTDLEAETGVPKDRIATAFGVCSSRCKWKEKNGEGEEKYVTSMTRFVGAGKAEGLTPEEAFKKWKAEYARTNTTLTAKGERAKASLMNRNGARGMSVLMGITTPSEELEGKDSSNKTCSFFDNIMQPGQTHEVTIDTHMTKAVQMLYGVSLPDAQAFVAATGGKVKDGNRVIGAGYVAIAEAVRQIAERYDVPPDVAQAAFWEKVQYDVDQIEWKDGKEWPSGKPKVKEPKHGKKGWGLWAPW